MTDIVERGPSDIAAEACAESCRNYGIVGGSRYDCAYRAARIALSDVATLRARADAAEAERNELREMNTRIMSLFRRQRERVHAAGDLWRAAHPGNDDTQPDLLELVEWLLSRAEAAEALLAEAKTVLDQCQKAFGALFSHCLSNGIFNTWGNDMDCSSLNEAMDAVETFLRAREPQP